MTQYSQLRSLRVMLLWCALLVSAWTVPQVAAQAVVATPVISSTAVPVGTTASLAIPPAGITVTVTCATPGATIRYTLDGTLPTAASTLYTDPVAIAEQLGLTAARTVTFQAKAFADGMTDSPTATASFINYAEAEFTLKFLLAGVSDGQTVLELGLATGATDEMESHDLSVATPPSGRDSGMPPPPGDAVRSLTPSKDFLVTDYRSRAQPKEWPLYVASESATPSITLKWGANAGFALPVAPYLHLLVDTNSDGTADQNFDLTTSGEVTLTQTYSPYDDGGVLTSYLRVVYQNSQSALTAAITPAEAVAAGAQWAYRPAAGGVFSAWQAAGTTVADLHSGDYEVTFSTVATNPALYTPPNQLVSVAVGETAMVSAAYMAQSATATMTASPTYTATDKTVLVNCTFTASPQVAPTQVVWTFVLAADWTLAITDLTEGWGYVLGAPVAAGGGTTSVAVTFTYTPPPGGSAGGGSSLAFSATYTYGGAGDPPATVDLIVTSVQGSGGNGDVNPDPPGTVSSILRTATLDVNGDGADTKRDLILILRYLPRTALGLGQTGNAIFPEGAPQPGDAVDAATLVTNIEALLPFLNVNGNAQAPLVTKRDLILILRYLPRPSLGLGQTGNAIFPEGAPQADDGVDAATLTQNIQAIQTAN